MAGGVAEDEIDETLVRTMTTTVVVVVVVMLLDLESGPGHVSVTRLVVPTAGATTRHTPRDVCSWASPCPKPEVLATVENPAWGRRSFLSHGTRRPVAAS